MYTIAISDPVRFHVKHPKALVPLTGERAGSVPSCNEREDRFPSRMSLRAMSNFYLGISNVKETSSCGCFYDPSCHALMVIFIGELIKCGAEPRYASLKFTALFGERHESSAVITIGIIAASS